MSEEFTGETIRYLRKRKNLTQGAFGELCGGFSKSQVSKLECRKKGLSLPRLEELCEGYGISASQFFLIREELRQHARELDRRIGRILGELDAPEEKIDVAKLLNLEPSYPKFDPWVTTDPDPDPDPDEEF